MIEDMLRSLRPLYFSMPQWIRQAIGGMYRALPNRVRLGPDYRRFVELLEHSKCWSQTQAQAYQLEQLQLTIRSAYRDIPFYRKSFDSHGVRPEDLVALDDIRKFPFLSKQDVKDNLSEMTNPRIASWRWLATTTGGSTAEPMRFYQIRGVTRSKERAFIWDQWRRFGYEPGLPVAHLKGRSVGDPSKRIFWEYDAIQNFLEMDSHHLTWDNLPAYVDAIIEFNPLFIIGYVSSVYLLAMYMSVHPNPKFPKLRGVFFTSENLYPWQRQLFEKVFQCPLCSHYGHSEMVLLGAECPNDSQYHFYPEYGFLEVIGADGAAMTNPGEMGELVGTSFHNPLMPFIRYRTQDFGVVGRCICGCGTKYPMIERVEGRLQEYIVTGDGRLISICVMGAAHFDVLDNVYQLQYYQDTPGQLVCRIVPRGGFSESDKETIRKAIEAKVGQSTIVTVENVASIPRTADGKHRMMIQRISPDLIQPAHAADGESPVKL